VRGPQKWINVCKQFLWPYLEQRQSVCLFATPNIIDITFIDWLTQAFWNAIFLSAILEGFPLCLNHDYGTLLSSGPVVHLTHI
jgi:hypothetical protein